jgi:hypothetical protein
VLFAVRSDQGIKAVLLASYTLGKPRSFFLIEPVRAVLRIGGRTQIAPSVIVATVIFVIDDVGRPSSGHVEVGQPRGTIPTPVNSDDAISVGLHTARTLADHVRPRALQPREHPSIRIVVQRLEQAGMGEGHIRKRPAVICRVFWVRLGVRGCDLVGYVPDFVGRSGRI